MHARGLFKIATRDWITTTVFNASMASGVGCSIAIGYVHTTLQAQAFEILAQCGAQLLALTLHLFALVLIGQYHLLGNVTTVLIVFIVVIKVVLQHKIESL